MKKKPSDPQKLTRKKAVKRIVLGIVVLGMFVQGTVACLALRGLEGPRMQAVIPRELPDLMTRFERGEHLEAEEIRAVSLQLDRDFHQQREEREQAASHARGLEKPYQGWYNAMKSLETQLEICIQESQGKQDFPEGSVERELQLELERCKGDRPNL